MGDRGAAENLDARKRVGSVQSECCLRDDQIAAVEGRVALAALRIRRHQPGEVAVLPGLAGRPVVILVHRRPVIGQHLRADLKGIDVRPRQPGEIDLVPERVQCLQAQRHDRRAADRHCDIVGRERSPLNGFAEDDLDDVERMPGSTARDDARHMQSRRRFAGDREDIAEDVLKRLSVPPVLVLVHAIPRQVQDVGSDGEDVFAGRRQRIERNNVTGPGRLDAPDRAQVAASRTGQRHIVDGKGRRIDRLRELHAPFEVRRDSRLPDDHAPRSLGVDRDGKRGPRDDADPGREQGLDRVQPIGQGLLRGQGVRAAPAHRQGRVEGAVTVEVDLDRAALVDRDVERRRVVIRKVVAVRQAGVARRREIETHRRRMVFNRERVAHEIGAVQQHVARKIDDGRRALDGEPVVIVRQRLGKGQRGGLLLRVEHRAGEQRRLVDLVAVLERAVAPARDQRVVARVFGRRRIDPRRIAVSDPHGLALDRHAGARPNRPRRDRVAQCRVRPVRRGVDRRRAVAVIESVVSDQSDFRAGQPPRHIADDLFVGPCDVPDAELVHASVEVGAVAHVGCVGRAHEVVKIVAGLPGRGAVADDVRRRLDAVEQAVEDLGRPVVPQREVVPFVEGGDAEADRRQAPDPDLDLAGAEDLDLAVVPAAGIRPGRSSLGHEHPRPRGAEPQFQRHRLVGEVRAQVGRRDEVVRTVEEERDARFHAHHGRRLRVDRQRQLAQNR